MSSARKFERHFTGAINAGLRAEIRRTVSAERCGAANRTAVLSLAGTVALTASGRACLEAAADDYAAVGGDGKATCECFDCKVARSEIQS